MAYMDQVTSSGIPADSTGASDGTGADDELDLLTAASRSGGAYRGNLAVLIRYWTVGRGRAKIGWGQPRDFYRCVNRLSKYVPQHMVKGFCARLHKRALGYWPNQGPHAGRRGRG